MARPKIFYSWQSDLDGKVNHYFLRDALKSACEELGAELDPADRPELDHDTKGVPGSPVIVQTILDKIDQATVFVADVSIIGMANTRPTPNPNVMLELGYAKKAVGSERVVMVCNTAFGEIRDLPFDIASSRVSPYHWDGAGGRPEALRRLAATMKVALSGALKVYDAARQGRTDTAAAQERARLKARTEQFEAWRKNVVGQPPSVPKLADPGTVFTLQIVPAPAFDDDGWRPNLDRHEQWSQGVDPPVYTSGYTGFSWEVDDAWVAWVPSSRTGDVIYYLRVFENGAIEFTESLSVPGDNLEPIARHAIKVLRRIAGLPARIGYAGPCFVSLDLRGIAGMEIRPLFPYPGKHPRKFEGPRMSPRHQVVDMGAADASEILRAPLTQVWKRAGYSECWLYSEIE